MQLFVPQLEFQQMLQHQFAHILGGALRLLVSIPSSLLENVVDCLVLALDALRPVVMCQRVTNIWSEA